MFEDKRLVRRFNKGDGRALCRIYERHKDRLLSLAVSLLNDRSGGEDVVHDVFVKFAESAGGFKLTGSLGGYLATCVANRARNVNRGERGREARSGKVIGSAGCVGSARGEVGDCVGYGVSVVVGVEFCEEVEELMRALDELPEEQREVVVLHVQYDVTLVEIGRMMGVSANTIGSRYRYGMDKLRAMLNGRIE